jgi:hypothetical protein
MAFTAEFLSTALLHLIVKTGCAEMSITDSLLEIEFAFNKELDIVNTSANGGTTITASCFF